MKTLDTAQEKLREARALFVKLVTYGAICITSSILAAWLILHGVQLLLVAPDVILSVATYVVMVKISRQMDRNHKEVMDLVEQDIARMKDEAEHDGTI